MLPADLQHFIDTEHWTFAKTMPDWPHEYLVREKVDARIFVKLVEHIRANGYEGHFYRRAITYFDHDGLTYWTMGAPVEETTIVNRCRKEETFEVRAARGDLPRRASGTVSQPGKQPIQPTQPNQPTGQSRHTSGTGARVRHPE